MLKTKKPVQIKPEAWDIFAGAVITEVGVMINDETKRKLRELNMPEIIEALAFQQAEPASLSMSFDERMQMLTDYVYQAKYNSRIQRLIKAAKLRFPQADMHSLYYDGRELNKGLLKELFTCQYIGCHQSIILQGPTGSGKTYLSCALGKQACLSQTKTRYIRFPELLMEYDDAAVMQGQQKKVISKYGKIPLLIIDEWLYLTFRIMNCTSFLNLWKGGQMPLLQSSAPNTVKTIG